MFNFGHQFWTDASILFKSAMEKSIKFGLSLSTNDFNILNGAHCTFFFIFIMLFFTIIFSFRFKSYWGKKMSKAKFKIYDTVRKVVTVYFEFKYVKIHTLSV